MIESKRNLTEEPVNAGWQVFVPFVNIPTYQVENGRGRIDWCNSPQYLHMSLDFDALTVW